MNIVTIPFRPEFKEALLSGRKVCTARTKRLGAGGDRFQAFGQWFELLSVDVVSLQEVKALWKEEGCDSPEHFVEVWNSLRRKKYYDGSQRVYLHRFKAVTEERDAEMA